MRYYFANLKLRVRDRFRFLSHPMSYENARRSFGPVVDLVSIEDTRYIRRARCLAHALGHAYIRAQALRITNFRQVGFRPVTVHVILHQLEGLDETDGAWDMTLTLGRLRDLSRTIPHAAALTRNLDDAFTMARILALAGVDTTLRVFVVRMNPLSRALVAASTAVLPLEHRERFRLEFYSELHEMHKSKKMQIAYGTRQLLGAFSLRRTLRRTKTASQEHVSD